MKTFYITSRGTSLIAGIATALVFLFSSCSKEIDNANNSNDQSYTTQGDASGSQLNPQVTTNGTARLVGTYNATTNDWQYSVSWASLTGSATLVEFHGPASAGVNGDILFSVNISAGSSNGATSGTIKLTEQQEAYLTSGSIYYTVLTTTHLTGEVRGQVYVLRR
jgi:hypothetical protein